MSSIVEEKKRRDVGASKIVGGPLQHERWCSGQHPSTLKCDNILEPICPDSLGGQDTPHASAVLSSRRVGGDAGHIPGCTRDHALSAACEVGGVGWAAPPTAAIVATVVHGLPEEQQRAVLRYARALAGGVSVDAREALGREGCAAWWGEDVGPAWDETPGANRSRWCNVGERLFAIDRASVVPPDADLARVIAAWPTLDTVGRTTVAGQLERLARGHWRDVAERVLSPDGCADLDRVRVTLHWSPEPGLRVVDAEVWAAIEPRAPTVEEWGRLRAAGVPVADGVGV